MSSKATKAIIIGTAGLVSAGLIYSYTSTKSYKTYYNNGNNYSLSSDAKRPVYSSLEECKASVPANLANQCEPTSNYPYSGFSKLYYFGPVYDKNSTWKPNNTNTNGSNAPIQLVPANENNTGKVLQNNIKVVKVSKGGFGSTGSDSKNGG